MEAWLTIEMLTALIKASLGIFILWLISAVPIAAMCLLARWVYRKWNDMWDETPKTNKED